MYCSVPKVKGLSFYLAKICYTTGIYAILLGLFLTGNPPPPLPSFLPPLDRMLSRYASPSHGYMFVTTYFYTRMEKGTTDLSCLAQELTQHCNSSQDIISNPESVRLGQPSSRVDPELEIYQGADVGRFLLRGLAE